MLSTFN